MRRLGRLLLAAWVLATAAFRRRPREPVIDDGGPEEGRVFERHDVVTRRAELRVAALLLAAALSAVGFVVAFFAAPHDTQLQGATLAGALALAGIALALASKRVVPQERAIEERPRLAHPEALPPVRERLSRTREGVSRRGLLRLAGGAAGVALIAAGAAPIASIGPAIGNSPSATPWRRGRRLVDTEGRPLRPEDVAPGAFVTALPEGADPRELGSPIVLVREDPRTLRLPPERRGWATPEGIVAYSKICTHAGCAIALYRSPNYVPTSDPPGLACPCHYSVFDPRTGGTVVSGPAGRGLPQLPLVVDAAGELRAGGGFSGPIGPAWWSVRRP
jgi:ubiquinol-cytochrome c reductase iron-sulfur subunit